MKLSTIFSLTIIFGYMGRSWTMSLVEPISYVLQIKYDLPLTDWETSCTEAYEEIKKLKIQATNLTLFQLKESISKKLPDPKSTEGLDDLVKKDCEDNQDVKNVSKNVLSSVKKCTLVEMAKEEEMEKELVKVLCKGVKSTVEWEIMVAKSLDEETEEDD